MPPVAEKDKARLRAWKSKVDAADKVWKRWDAMFPGDYYEGLYLGTAHWMKADGSPDSEQRYAKLFYNLTASDIELLKPYLVLQRPSVNLTPNPMRADDELSVLEDMMSDMEPAATTLVQDKRTGFISEVELAIHETFFRMGIVEAVYSASPVDNPNAKQPMKDEKGEPLLDPDTNAPILEPEQTIQEDEIVFKRVPARNFRFAPTKEWMLERVPWYGYCEWIPLSDLKADKRLSNTENLKAGGRSDLGGSDGAESEKEKEEKKGCVLVWKLWDNLKKRKLWFADNSVDGFLLEEEFLFRTIAVCRVYPILNEPYPKPIVADWPPLQIEANETREMGRIHRNRAKRRYLSRKDALGQSEKDKLESGPDCSVIEVDSIDPRSVIVPMEDAPLDRAVFAQKADNQRDFDQIARVSAEQRGVASAGTATQASIMAGSSKIGAEFIREKVSSFLSDIVEIAIKLSLKYRTTEQWVEMVTDQLSPAAPQNQQVAAAKWEKVKWSDLLKKNPHAVDKFAWTVRVEVERAQGDTTDLERDRWNATVQNIFSNPMAAVFLMAVPSALKQTLHYYNMDSDKRVKEFQQGLQAVMGFQQQQQQAEAAAKQGAPPSGGGVTGAGRQGPAPAGQGATAAQVGG
jgi:hypothetical protein